MKLFKSVFFTILAGFIFQPKIEAIDAVITFFVKEKKSENKKSISRKSKFISESLMQPSFLKGIRKDRSWSDQLGVDGLHASYLGYLATSDKNGQITFPRHHQKDTIYILVTPEVQPEFMISPSLINHWLTKNKKPSAFYEISRKKNKKLNVYYFDVKKFKTPHDIPMNTITIYAHPDHITIPTGISLNSYSTNFILPELQAQNLDLIKNSLYTLEIKQYFEQINKECKNDMPSITAMVMNQ
jgi:hypothetical protein